MIDREKLLEFLARRAREAPPGGDPGLLVQHSIYEGLANRVKSGEFDSPYRQPPPGWFDFGSHADGFDGPLEFSEETDDGGMPLWERHLDRKDADA